MARISWSNQRKELGWNSLIINCFYCSNDDCLLALSPLSFFEWPFVVGIVVGVVVGIVVLHCFIVFVQILKCAWIDGHRDSHV